MSARAFAPGGLVPLLRVDGVAVAAQARPGRRGRDARVRPPLRRGRGAVGHHRAPARPRLRALSRPRDGPSADGARGARGARLPARAGARASPPTPTSSASRATRRWRRRSTPSTSCRGFIMACAYVRPTGIHGLTPEVGQEEDEDAGVRRRGQPRRAARGRRGARRRLRRAPRVRDRRARGARGRARAQRLRAVRMPDAAARSSSSTATRPARSCSSRRSACSTPTSAGAARRARAPRPLARAAGARRRNACVTEAARGDARGRASAIKAATVTPEGKDDVGSPNRILREEVDGKVIIRTGRRIPGAVGPVSGVHYPISVVRMAVGDAYGAEQWREGEEGSLDEVALRTERITRGVCRAVAEFAFRAAERAGARVYGGPKWTVSPVYEGMLKEEMDAAAERHPDVDYQPVLIDATYAGLLERRRRRPARDPGAEPRRRLPVGPRDADVRLDRGRGVDPARASTTTSPSTSRWPRRRTAPRRRCRARTSRTRWR